MPRNIIVDTDPGVDDAVALLLALAAPEELSVLGVVAVAGNLPLAPSFQNAREICALAGRAEVPVYAGCERPLLRPPTGAAAVHGERLGARLGLPEPALPPAPARHGVDFIIDTVRAAPPGSVTVAALGPLTDIAVALVKAPDVAPLVAEIVIMGGAAFELGNVTPAAEFNIHADPHAAAVVLGSGAKLTMVPLDLTHRVLTTASRLAALRALPNRCGAAVATLLADFEAARTTRFGERGLALHDPCVIAYLIRPDLFAGRTVNVAVETTSPLSLGMTVVDWWGVTGRPANVTFLTEVDAERLYLLLTERLAQLP